MLILNLFVSQHFTFINVNTLEALNFCYPKSPLLKKAACVPWISNLDSQKPLQIFLSCKRRKKNNKTKTMAHFSCAAPTVIIYCEVTDMRRPWFSTPWTKCQHIELKSNFKSFYLFKVPISMIHFLHQCYTFVKTNIALQAIHDYQTWWHPISWSIPSITVSISFSQQTTSQKSWRLSAWLGWALSQL